MAQKMQAYAGFQYFAVTSPAPFVAHVEISRAEKLNAFVEPMWLEMGAVFRQLSADPDVRAVVLSGAGERAFTAGLDVMAASEGAMLGGKDAPQDVARAAAVLRRHIYEFQDSVGAVEKCEKPVICVVHGIAYGLAIDITCCADVRIAAKNARFSVKEVDIGIAADIGTLSRLPKAVGNFSWVKEVCLTAREFGAAEALSVGFVSHVVETKAAALEAALALAGSIASKSPVATLGTKELLNHARDHSVPESLRYTAIWNSAHVQSNDVKAALLSGIQKTKPRFEKL